MCRFEDAPYPVHAVIAPSLSVSLPSALLQPNHYHSTVKRLDDGYRVCDQIVACFQDRAKIERSYALQMEEWTRKWRPLVDASELLGITHYLRGEPCCKIQSSATFKGQLCFSLCVVLGNKN